MAPQGHVCESQTLAAALPFALELCAEDCTKIQVIWWEAGLAACYLGHTLKHCIFKSCRFFTLQPGCRILCSNINAGGSNGLSWAPWIVMGTFFLGGWGENSGCLLLLHSALLRLPQSAADIALLIWLAASFLMPNS